MTLKELFKREFLRGYRTGRGFKETLDKDLDEVYIQYLFLHQYIQLFSILIWI